MHPIVPFCVDSDIMKHFVICDWKWTESIIIKHNQFMWLWIWKEKALDMEYQQYLVLIINWHRVTSCTQSPTVKSTWYLFMIHKAVPDCFPQG